MKRSGQILCTFWRKYQRIGGGISERIIFRLKTGERLMWASWGRNTSWWGKEGSPLNI